MGDPRGFMKIQRVENEHRRVEERLQDYLEIELSLPPELRQQQAARCMDCGVPFCHWACPVANNIPEWQHALYQGDWKMAYELLQDTNSFPEFTGRICPAPCEASCVLSIGYEPVTIRQNELAIIEHAFQHGYVQPRPPLQRTGKRVAVIGSGPAGLACADLLNKFGHHVVLYEAADQAGGFLRYGVPDFKLDKQVIDRRLAILQEEGLIIQTGVQAGADVSVDELRARFDALCLAIGARQPRDLKVEGRQLRGIHQAVDYLEQQNRVNRGQAIPEEERITAACKHVVVIGGGDTGSDCVGTANRQGARSVTQIEILEAPPLSRTEQEPWPLWPKIYRTSSSHEEGCERSFSISTRRFIGQDGHVKALSLVRVRWYTDENGRCRMAEEPDSEYELDADLVILAMGFEHAVHEGLVAQLGIRCDPRGNLAVDERHMTNVPGVFACGDARRGASLLVWAIHEGRNAARHIDAYLRS